MVRRVSPAELASLGVGVMRCHAGAGHELAADHGLSGWLCDGCWTSLLKILERFK